MFLFFLITVELGFLYQAIAAKYSTEQRKSGKISFTPLENMELKSTAKMQVFYAL